MAKIHTIKENHLFSKVYAKGKCAAGKYVVVYALPNFRTSETKLGITTNKKLGGAVERNRARRLIREAFRLTAAKACFVRPYLIVIVARSALFEKSARMNHALSDIENAFTRLALTKGGSVE